MKKIILLLAAVILTACNLQTFDPYAAISQAPPSPAGPTQTTQPGTEPSPSQAPQYCTVTTGAGVHGALNLRTCAGTDCAVIRVLAEGEILQVLTPGHWLEVMTEQNEHGYINSKYCKG